ncbi:MAG: 1-deoxy-D-xylulose-5-phosphate reductoisomerase [Candidatus Cloacimonetes bacterium HGW-Cloacimonetes-3]|jgi:1-deoxy-D-xylulose-5-phosphate reductoisomerase|nr:MAG: 1-deoxy-D-xylulose-5-phosphate reductoisomerase [Candidatus Cloacimonetes bacterium HGW-Cloacimonetes-3]
MVNRNIALLGATGSIGTSTLDVVSEQGLGISLASAHQDYNKLIDIANRHSIPCIVLTGIDDSTLQSKLKLDNPSLRIYFGEEELLQLLRGEDYDIALNAITGSAGLRSSFAILERGKALALANKESLVMAGHLLTKLIKDKPIIPVDSEHSAIFQAIGTHPLSEVKQLHITASGGAFRDLPMSEFAHISPQEALKHPNWNMGAKVTLDSATMFNKALEVIEAHWLFGLPYEQISAIIHPQSIIHSLVEFIDGSLLAQLSTPDMKLPILYALSYPHRTASVLVKTDLGKLSGLTFREIEPQRYPLFFLGLEVGKSGGIQPTVMNAAVEAASMLFLNGKIAYTDMMWIVYEALDTTPNISEPDLETIIRVNREVFEKVSTAKVRHFVR